MIPALSKEDLLALYALLGNPQGTRRKDVALLLQQRHPKKSTAEALHLAGLVLSSLHTIGAVVRNQWYYVLTPSGHTLKQNLEQP